MVTRQKTRRITHEERRAMARFLIEVPHEATVASCARAMDALLKSGSHFLTHADWGCKDGVHKAWAIVEVDSKDEARAIVPPAFRHETTIVQLNFFTMQDLDNLVSRHQK
jgi:hypothetical protein